MSRGKRKIRREQPAGRPSIFFILALAAGILFLLWFFVQALKHPVNEQSPKKHSANRVTPLLAQRSMIAARLEDAIRFPLGIQARQIGGTEGGGFSDAGADDAHSSHIGLNLHQ